MLLSDRAANSVGLPDGVGSLVTLDRLPYSAAGFYRPMRTIEFLQPLALAPRRLSEEGEVAIVVVLARKPRDVAVLAEVIRPLLDPVDPLKVSFETSGRLAALRATIERQLSGFGRASVVVIVVLNGTLVATLLYGMVLLRRKDFGRRRALGASRSFIVALVAGQAVLVSSLGATLGLALGHTALVLSDQPLPTVRFTGAVFVLALTTSIVAAFAPAWAASRRDPVLELRVP